MPFSHQKNEIKVQSNGVLSVCQLTLSSGGHTLVTDLNQDFSPGEIWCVMGPNGAGKTTLIQTLAGLYPAQHGYITLDGRALSSWSTMELARRRAWMPQFLQDAFALTVMESLLLARHPYRNLFGVEEKRTPNRNDIDHDRVQAVLRELEISELGQRPLSSLSGGERQRVALAAALCQDTNLLLLDEPLAHIDIPHQLTCLRALRACCHSKKNGVAGCVIFSGHDFYIAGLFATHVLLLNGQGVAVAGTVQDVLTPECVSHVFAHPFRWIREEGKKGNRFLMPIL